MKKISLFLLAFTLSCSLSAQVYVDLGSGIDKRTWHPVGHIAAGFQFHSLTFEGYAGPSFSSDVRLNNYLGIKQGITIRKIVNLSIGYFKNYHSSDDKQLNWHGFGYSAKLLIPVAENGNGIFVNSMYIEKNLQITVGFHAVID